MVGLDAAGKTTILYKLKLGEIVTTIPTIGESRSAASVHVLVLHSQYYCVLLCRVQRGDGGVQEHQLHCVGCRRPGQDPPPVETLLPEHTG